MQSCKRHFSKNSDYGSSFDQQIEHGYAVPNDTKSNAHGHPHRTQTPMAPPSEQSKTN